MVCLDLRFTLMSNCYCNYYRSLLLIPFTIFNYYYIIN